MQLTETLPKLLKQPIMNLVSSAAAGVQLLLWILWYELALLAHSFGSMHENFFFYTNHAKLDQFHEN